MAREQEPVFSRNERKQLETIRTSLYRVTLCKIHKAITSSYEWTTLFALMNGCNNDGCTHDGMKITSRIAVKSPKGIHYSTAFSLRLNSRSGLPNVFSSLSWSHWRRLLNKNGGYNLKCSSSSNCLSNAFGLKCRKAAAVEGLPSDLQ